LDKKKIKKDRTDPTNVLPEGKRCTEVESNPVGNLDKTGSCRKEGPLL